MTLKNFIESVYGGNPTLFARERNMSRGRVLNMLRRNDYFVYKGRYLVKIVDKFF